LIIIKIKVNKSHQSRNKSQSHFITFYFRQGGRAGVKAARAAALQYEAVHAGVCGRARGSVWRCTRQCVTVRLIVYESARGSVRLCDSVAVCGCAAGRACVAVR
jgi:hypothetical protein